MTLFKIFISNIVPCFFLVTPLVKKAPTVFLTQANHSVPEGQKVEFHCKAIGIPTPTVSWTRKGGKLPDTAVQTEPGILKIESAVSGDEGMYECTARNSEGSTTASVKLEVQGESSKEDQTFPIVHCESIYILF